MALAAIAGLSDTATGLLLVTAPRLVLSLLDLPSQTATGSAVPAPLDGSALLAWRWIGAFVGSVGLAYLYPLLPRWRCAGRLRTVFEVTALQRAAVALLVGGALACGALPPGWWVVAATDATLALTQLALLRRGGWE